MQAVIILSVFTQCMVSNVQKWSGIEIVKSDKAHDLKPARSADKRQCERLINTWTDTSPELDVRLLSLAYMESRLRTYAKRGDKGKACGVYQIHARHSFPLFRRKRGYVDWKEDENQREIQLECARLERLSYSMETAKRLLGLIDKKDKHACHHNSGIYAKRCNAWYKYRLDLVTDELESIKQNCLEKEKEMAMMRTGNPVAVAPSELIQGYLDFMSGKEASSQDEVYMKGYNLAQSVKKGEAEAPVWAK